MNGRLLPFSRVALWSRLLIVLALVGCSHSTVDADNVDAVRITAAVPPGRELPDFSDASELEHAVVAFAQCVEKSFPIAVRFRVDPFLGLSTEVASQRKEEGDAVDRVSAACNARFDLDRRLSAFQTAHPVTPEQDRALASDYVDCVKSVSAQVAVSLVDAAPTSYEDVLRFASTLDPTNVPPPTLVAVSACQAELEGTRQVFSTGHPWFTDEGVPG